MTIKQVKEDVRGVIEWHQFGKNKFNVLFTKKGSKRSGDVHPCTQCDYVIVGSVKVTTRHTEFDDDKKPFEKEKVEYYCTGEAITILGGVPHLFEFLEDTLMVEHWTGEYEGLNAPHWYDEEYRKVVEQSMKEETG